MANKMKSLGKAASALTLIVAASSGVAMAHDAVNLVSPSTEALAKVTAIQLADLNSPVTDTGALASVLDHNHDHDNNGGATAMSGIIASEFNV